LAEHFVKAHGAIARDVMSTNVVTVGQDASVEDITRLMEAHRIKRVLVVHDGKLVGLVSRADLLRAVLPPQGAELPASDAGDSAILRAITGMMRDQPWVDTFWTYVSVHDGVVAFYGYVRSNLVREGLKAIAQEITGVRRVEDHTEPMPLILRATL
jgi:predicted transcriptional regulator